MTTIELPPSPLPRRPPQYEVWREIQPNFVGAYDAVLNAERHANEQTMIGPEAKDNLISARVAGYLLLELYNRRTTLADRPSSSLVKSIVSPSQDGGGSVDVVFAVGKFYRNILLRMCAFGFFLPGSASQSPCSPYGQHEVSQTHFTPFAPLLCHVAGYYQGLHDGRWKQLWGLQV